MNNPEANGCKFHEDRDPKLRHEFVGMMFAVVVGEIGLQFATLVQKHNSFHHLLPMYTHLFLAAFVVAVSWVGWALSKAPGARQDLKEVFGWDFVVLLLDVSLVILYFILTRSVDQSERMASDLFVPPEALWIFIIFIFYLVWDLVTKVPHMARTPGTKKYIWRFIPTFISLVLAGFVWRTVNEQFKASQIVITDVALIVLIFFFRAGKDVISDWFPLDKKGQFPGCRAVLAGTLFILFLALFILAKHGPVPWLEDYIAAGN